MSLPTNEEYEAAQNTVKLVDETLANEILANLDDALEGLNATAEEIQTLLNSYPVGGSASNLRTQINNAVAQINMATQTFANARNNLNMFVNPPSMPNPTMPPLPAPTPMP